MRRKWVGLHKEVVLRMDLKEVKRCLMDEKGNAFFQGGGEVELRLRYLTDANIRLKGGIKKKNTVKQTGLFCSIKPWLAR